MLKRDIALIEQVQRRFTKRLPGLKNHPLRRTVKIIEIKHIKITHNSIWLDLVLGLWTVFGLLLVNVDDFSQLRVSNRLGYSWTWSSLQIV